MRRRLLPVFVLALAPVACDGGGGGGGGIDDILALTGDAGAGQAVFNSTCANASCHGADGASGTGPSLPVVAPAYDREGLTRVVFNGTGTMPAQNLSDQDIADVVAYVQETFGG